jgi:GT2 family glycosyltransferase
VQRSQELLLSLRATLARSPVDAIEFSAASGLGLRLVQARRTGLDFASTALVAVVPDEILHTELLDPQQNYAEFARHHSFQHADIRSGNAEVIRARAWDTRRNVEPLSLDRYAALLRQVRATPETTPPAPLVTVAVTFYNLGAYLPAQIDSLLAQSYSNLEILLIDDGSPRPEEAEIARQQAQRDPRIRLIRQANAGLGAARNTALAQARGEFFLPVDADNVSGPDMVASFVRGLTRSPDLDCVTCFSWAFTDDAELPRQAYRCAFRPAGGPRVLAAIENVLGDANGCFRTAVLRATGGYTTERDTTYEDWETYLRVIQADHGVEVVPAPLFFYRVRTTSMQRTTSTYRNLQRVLRQWAQGTNLPPLEERMLGGLLRGLFLRTPEGDDELMTARCRTQLLRDRADSLRHRLVGRRPA